MKMQEKIEPRNEYHHDPIRQAHFLRESIQLGRKPLGLFLGAGCPLAIQIPVENRSNAANAEDYEETTGNMADTHPLIPDIRKMTQLVIANLKKKTNHKKGIETLCDHLSKETNEANLEDFLTHLRALISISGGEEVRGLKANEMVSLERAICEEIFQLVYVSLPDKKGPYHQLAQWIGSVDREHSVELFTTNYDLLMEEALEDLRVPYFDGFIGTKNPFFDPLAIDEEEMPKRWAGLWKLHGSINWKQEIATRRVSRGDPSQISEQERRLIHPSHLKYDESRRMPYLAMFDRLKSFMRKPSCLLVTIGFSFDDEHLNEVIRQSLERNTGAHCFGLLYGSLKDYEKALSLADKRSNLSLLGWNEAVIGGRRAPYPSKRKDEVERPSSLEITWDSPTESPQDKDVPGDTGSDSLVAHFRLGDFTRFGSFLEDIIGAEHLLRTRNHAQEELTNVS